MNKSKGKLSSNNIRIILNYIDEKTKNLVTKADISHLPTKQDFYNKMDEVMSELKIIRDNQEVNTHRITSNEKQITHIKDKLSLSSSS